jgi:GntR family transcriptional regulator / MocR family aminotransferase
MLRPWKLVLSGLQASSAMPLYLQIVHGLIQEIERGRLQPGTYLPSSRAMATSLGVNRKTVVLAYEDLIAQGWLLAVGTRGTVVADYLPEMSSRRARPPVTTVPAAAMPEYEFNLPPSRPLSLPTGDWVKLDEGSPDSRLFPADVLSRAYRSSIQRAFRENRLLYGNPRGSPLLRDKVATMLKSERGLAVTAENICITRGSQSGIYIIARTLISPGDTVLVESLTYEAAVAALSACGARIVSVKLDHEGVDVADVERQCRAHSVKAIFLTPHHQFPTTVALRPQRRLRLLELSRQFGFAIIEDDYDHEFHFESQPLLPMASYAPSRVLYVGSLSKLLLPALRIGYIAAPKAFIDAVAHTVSLIDSMGNTLTENTAADLIESGELRRHARKVFQVYAARRQAFAQSLTEELGDFVNFRLPDGGLAFWLTFKRAADLDRMEANLPGHGIRVADSRSFATSKSSPRGLRIGFASLREDEARVALNTLARAARG